MFYLKIDMLHLYLKLLFSSYDADESIVNCCQRRITKTECARNCDLSSFLYQVEYLFRFVLKSTLSVNRFVLKQKYVTTKLFPPTTRVTIFGRHSMKLFAGQY